MERAIIIVLSVVESIQALAVIRWIADACPPFKTIMGEVQYLVIFCVLSLSMGYVLGKYLLADNSRNRSSRHWKAFCLVESLLTFFLLSALFKMTVYSDQAQLARYAYQWVLLASFLNKVFWNKILGFGRSLGQFINNDENIPVLVKTSDVLFVILIVLIIHVPDVESMVARIFLGEQFHHWDSSIMAAGWAHVSGCTLAVDVISRYGIGMPIIVAELTKVFGGFSFEHVLAAMIWIAMIYFVLWYVLLRKWFNSILLAMAVLMMGIKTQLFRSLSLPFAFTYPTGTVLRYCFDIFALAFIFFHLRNPKRSLLVLAALFCGVSLFHSAPEGMYLTAAYYFYLLMHLIIPSLRPRLYKAPKDLLVIAGYMMIVPLSMLLLLWSVTGHYFWEQRFWTNSIEFLAYHTSGLALGPMLGNLKQHNLLSTLIGFLVPLFELVTVLAVTSLCYFRKIAAHHLFAAVLGVYGLGQYHYYVAMSYNDSYYVGGLEFVVLAGYWIDLGLKRLDRRYARNIALMIFAGMVYSLVTTHLFLAYPNIFNLSRNPLVDPLVRQIPPGRQSYFHHLFWEYPDAFKLPFNSLGERDEGLVRESDFSSDEAVKDYYRRELNFPEDAALIQKLTAPQEKVALISSFEIKILMQAQRKPFFYYFPIVNSRPMRMRIFVVPNYFTFSSTQRTIDQLAQDGPEYVFMEAIFLNRTFPKAYEYDSQGFIELINYVNDHFEPYARGKYLVAMRKKT